MGRDGAGHRTVDADTDAASERHCSQADADSGMSHSHGQTNRGDAPSTHRRGGPRALVTHGTHWVGGREGTGLSSTRRVCTDGGTTARDTHPEHQADANPLPWLALNWSTFVKDDRDPRIDQNVPMHVVESAGQTGFDPTDADDDVAHWRALDELQNGRGEQDRSVQVHEATVERALDVVCGQFGVTPHQRERAQFLLDNVGVKTLVPSGPLEVAVLAVVTTVIDEDRTRYGRAGRAVQSALRDTACDEMVDAYTVSYSQIHDARTRLRAHDAYDSPND